VPRFHSVRRVSKMTPEAFLARTTNVDFRDEAVITADDPIPPTADADVALREYRDDEQRLDVRAPSATLLVSSEKLTPELAVTIDGTPAHIIPTNLLFAAVAVPPGNHTVVFSRRLARGWWWVAAGALFAALVLSALDVTRLRRLP